jgi:hypothetical protein
MQAVGAIGATRRACRAPRSKRGHTLIFAPFAGAIGELFALKKSGFRNTLLLKIVFS